MSWRDNRLAYEGIVYMLGSSKQPSEYSAPVLLYIALASNFLKLITIKTFGLLQVKALDLGKAMACLLYKRLPLSVCIVVTDIF